MDEKTEPIEISLIWYESDKEQVKPYLEIFQKELTRNPDAPFSRELHLPLYFFELHKGEKFPAIKIDGQKAIAFIFTSSRLIANDQWCSDIEALRKSCCVVPIALDKNGLGYSALADLNAIRSTDFSRDYIQKKSVVLWAMHEIYRVINDAKRDERLNLFLSHCKGSNGEALAKRLKDMIDNSTISRFFDAYSIMPGVKFDKSIRDSIEKSTVIAINSDCYEERKWCQYELLEAKRNNRPIIGIDMLTNGSDRSFPYGANIPVIRICDGFCDCDLLDVLIMAVKESIRFAVEKQRLKKWCDDSNEDFQICCNVPEPVFLIGKNHGSINVLYPDPPVYDEEKQLLSGMGINAVTPSTIDKRSVKGMKVQISISNPNESELKSLGMNLNHIKALQYSITHFLAGDGADILYGGYLDRGGFTFSICVELQEWKNRDNSFEGKLINYETSMNINGFDQSYNKRQEIENTIAMFKDVLDVYVEMNGGMVPYASFTDSSTDPVRALSIMRRSLSSLSDAHIIMGGRCHNYRGRMPGILEEFMCSIDNHKAVFLIGGFGGVSARIRDLYEENISDTVFCNSFHGINDDEELYRQAAEKIHEFDFHNGLSAEENQTLMSSRSEYEIIGLIRKGLIRLNCKSAKSDK